MTRLLIAHSQRSERDLLRNAAGQRLDLNLVASARDGQEAVQLAIQFRPDVAVLVEGLSVLDVWEAAALISAVAPEVKLLLVTEDSTATLVRRAMRAGVREVMSRETPPLEIMAAAAKLGTVDEIRARPEYQNCIDPERFTRVVAVTAAKGGVGKTSVVVNLGVSLALECPEPVCIVDLYAQFGDVATMLDLQPRQTLIDLAKSTDEIDAEMIDAATLRHSSGLDVVLTAATPHALEALSADRLEEVFSILRRRYRFVVVDVPPILHSGTIFALETAHLTLLVCNLLDLTTVTDTCRFVRAVEQSLLSRERLRLVLNRVSGDTEFGAEQVEKTVGLKVWLELPDSEKLVSGAANRGVPFVTQSPQHPLSQALRRAAHTLITDPDGQQVPSPRSETSGRSLAGLLSLFGRTPGRVAEG